jgi:predicted RNase H-like HicB family nuclease
VRPAPFAAFQHRDFRLLWTGQLISEAGTPYPVREEEILFHFEGIINVLKYFSVIEGDPRRVEPLVSKGSIRLLAEEGGYWAEVPSLPGCYSQGNSVEKTLKNVKEAIESGVYGFIYKPFNLDEVCMMVNCLTR